jgi:chemotaxis protein MotB
LLKPPNKSDKKHETVVKRSSRKHDHESHGGAWKVAFADFSLALMCLFLVLWVLAARNAERLEQILKAPGGNPVDEGQSFKPEPAGGPRGSLIERNPVQHRGDATARGIGIGTGGVENPNPVPEPTFAKQRYESPAELLALSKMLAQLSAEAGLAQNLQTIVTPSGLRVLLHDTDRQGMFERGSAVPDERFVGLLRKMGPLFARMENQMVIVGHTDAVQYADHGAGAFSNWQLSSNRAMAARAQLLEGGMAADSILQVVGMADRAPIDAKDATAAVNRRIELLVLTDGQARNISAMFGMPAQLQPLTPEADLALPDHETLQALRARLPQQHDAR